MCTNTHTHSARTSDAPLQLTERAGLRALLAYPINVSSLEMTSTFPEESNLLSGREIGYSEVTVGKYPGSGEGESPRRMWNGLATQLVTTVVGPIVAWQRKSWNVY